MLHRIAKIRSGMIDRCYRPLCDHYQEYGGRGIKICNEWLDPENGVKSFYNWAINNGYDDSLSIDRIDVNGDYCPENCRWVNTKIQSNNRTSCRYITYKEYTFPIAIWVEILNIPRNTFVNRLDRGWSIEDSLRTPPGSPCGCNKIDINVPEEYLIYNKYQPN